MPDSLAFYLIIIALIGVILVLLWKRNSPNALSPELTSQIQQITSAQQQLTGSLTQISSHNRENFQNLQDKLTQQDKYLSEKLNNQAQTGEKLMGDVKERLAKIITAQENIDKLSGSVLDLKNILDDKQKRGLFGEVRLNDQIKDSLPQSAYKLQAKLSNGKIADCILFVPDDSGGMVIDAKFPLEGFRAFNAASTDDEIAQTRKQFAVDVKKHIDAIADKYLIAGETADIAMMFIPSETIYSDIHQNMPGIIEYSNKKRVYLASPTTLMALLTTIRAILHDTEMRHQALKIRDEVLKISDDIERLDKRVADLAGSYQKMGKNIDEIQTSSGKISKRAYGITHMELNDTKKIANIDEADDKLPPPPALPLDDNSTP